LLLFLCIYSTSLLLQSTDNYRSQARKMT
jgi:hypothetical protein